MESATFDIAALAQALHAEVIETHISWVLLAGAFAYKVKKPVRLAFVDYSSLQARRKFCEEELRLNRRLAPGLYLDVVEITGPCAQPAIAGQGSVLDYAVRMRRFEAGALFSERLAAGLLQASEVDALAALLARFHESAPVASASSGHGVGPARGERALAALDGLGPFAGKDGLREWLRNQAQSLAPLWEEREKQGRVRECHGDLHLANVVRLDGQVAAFDGVEFDPALRWIDVVDDIAFAVMDFDARGRGDFAFRLLNAWLDITGDHGTLPALRFAVAYRALVRAQVEHMKGDGAASGRYVDTALAWTRTPGLSLTITHGLPGSGKTWISQQLLESGRAIRLRSDVERKRLYGVAMLEDSRAKGLDLYTAEAGERTYARLFALARGVLEAGWPVIIDAAFLRAGERSRAHELARGLRASFAIVACEAPLGVLRERVLARHGDASEAGVEVIDRLAAAAEPLTAAERASVRVDQGQCTRRDGR